MNLLRYNLMEDIDKFIKQIEEYNKKFSYEERINNCHYHKIIKEADDLAARINRADYQNGLMSF